MNKLRESAFLNKLNSLELEPLARHLGIENCYTKKVHARDLLVSFLLLINHGAISLSAWASQLSLLTGQPLSKQAMALKFDARHQAFFEQVLAKLLKHHLHEPAYASTPDDLWAPFARVLVEDSTCFSLPDHLHTHFPSSYCATGAKATLRLQWLQDLKAERPVRFAIQRYRDNDQRHAPAVVALAQAGDLVLRDLGYFSTAVFEALDQQGAFFLSRLHYRVQVRDASTEAVIDLVKLIEAVETRGWLDCAVLLGSTQRLRVRLVGLRLPEEVVAARRRRARARAKKDPRRGYSPRYAKWLAWSFFVTNVPSSLWSSEEVARAYRLRWRIEMLFKAFTHMGQVGSLLNAPRLSYSRVMMTMLGVLLYALLVVWPYYRYFCCRIDRLSLLRFLQWLRAHLLWVLLSSSVGQYAGLVACHCVYERRQKRKNYLELRYDTYYDT